MNQQPKKTFSDDEGFLHTRSNDFGKSPMALIHDTTVTDGACRLYAHMHWRYGSSCKNREGRKSMGDFFDVSETTITNRVNELVARDWVVAVPRTDEHGKTHNFYHVFETQEDCLLWRQTHNQPKVGLVSRVRKSRRGVGGSVTHKVSSSTQVDPQLKLSTDLNLSSHYPESFDPELDSNAGALGDSKIQKPAVESKKVEVAPLPNGGHPAISGVPVIKAAYEDLDVNSKRVALIETYYKSIPPEHLPKKQDYGGKNATIANKWVDLGYTPTELALIVRDQFGCDEKGRLLEDLPKTSKEGFQVNAYRTKSRLHGLDFAAIDSHWTAWLLTAKSHLSVNGYKSNDKAENSHDSKNALPEVQEGQIDNTWALPETDDPIPDETQSRESATS